jgi:hypothetical protein
VIAMRFTVKQKMKKDFVNIGYSSGIESANEYARFISAKMLVETHVYDEVDEKIVTQYRNGEVQNNA